jgi:hypothetical protein
VAVRPKAFEFPQDEIFRVYAMQMHLKKMARVLKAARSETSRIG